MLVLGLQGSPRLKGNTRFLLTSFLDEIARTTNAQTRMIDVCRQNIQACKELVVCEKKGVCPIKDDMDPLIYPLLRQATVVITATPIFFYNTTAQLKALIDRSQTLWARKYRLGLRDPLHHTRRGFLLAVGATRGKQLFDGLHLTTQYFCDAITAHYHGSLTYRQIEHPGDMAAHPTVIEDIRAAVQALMAPYKKRKRICFVCRDNALLSQMAAGFAQYQLADRWDVEWAGLRPAEAVDAGLVDSMAEKKIDMAFRLPANWLEVKDPSTLDWVVTIGPDAVPDPMPADANHVHWDIAAPDGDRIGDLSAVRDHIDKAVTELMDQVNVH